MIGPNALHPEWARLMARLAAFLDEAELAMATAQPQQLVQAGSAWAQLCRELRRLPDAQCPSPAIRKEVLGKAAMRIAALQQATGRAQASITRELTMLAQPEGSGAVAGEPGTASATGVAAAAGTYDATGGRHTWARSAGAYA